MLNVDIVLQQEKANRLMFAPPNKKKEERSRPQVCVEIYRLIHFTMYSNTNKDGLMNGTIISTSTSYTQLQRNQRKTHIEYNHNNIIPYCIALLCTVVGRFHHFSSSVDVFRSLSHQIACDIL